MIVLILEKATASLRGELTRWLMQPKTGVYVGWLSARVRDLLWQKVTSATAIRAATMIYSDSTEQGFSVRYFGDPSKEVVDFEGLFLAKTPEKA
jgi:CRISPR-associated protein Cas2